MNRLWIRNMIRWVLLLAADIFLLSKLEFTPWVRPHIFILFILLLPARTYKAALLTIAFITGFVMDVFLDTGGIHAFSATLMAFARILIMPLFVSTEDYANNITPGLRQFGASGFLFYAGILVLIYNTSFFTLEIFKSSFWLLISGKTLLSSLATLILIWLIELAFHPKRADS